MNTLTFALAALLLPLSAQAQTTFQVLDDRAVVEANGAGAPTIAWDEPSQTFRMYYETQVAVRGCDEAWALRVVTSNDGVRWGRPHTVLEPTRGTAFACGARRPAVSAGHNGTWLFFNVVDETSEDRVAAWRIGDSPRSIQVIPELDGLIEPTVANYDDQWVMLAIRSDPADPAIVTARSPNGVDWTLDAGDAIHKGATPWSTQGTLSPSLLCKDAATYPWEIWYGGWDAVNVGWTWGISNDAKKWYVAPPITLWADDSAWISWDAVRIGTDDTLLAYETMTSRGIPVIGVAATSTTWTPTDARTRRCVKPTAP